MAVSIKYRELIPLGWQEYAACRDPGLAELFFGPSDDGDVPRTPAEAARLDEAMRVCRRCPVQPACLEHALRYPERWGVWGGMTQQARALLRNRLMQRRRRRLAG